MTDRSARLALSECLVFKERGIVARQRDLIAKMSAKPRLSRERKNCLHGSLPDPRFLRKFWPGGRMRRSDSGQLNPASEGAVLVQTCRLRPAGTSYGIPAFSGTMHKTPQTMPVVLIVEDEPFVRLVVAEALLEHELQVLEAATADEAIALLNRRKDIGLLFTDINMPGSMDGLALAKLVHRRWPKLPIILTSGRGGVPEKALPANSEFVGKPYDFETLAARILTLLRT